MGGGTRTAIRNMKDAQSKGLAPDLDALRTQTPEQKDNPRMHFSQALTNLRQDANYSRMSDSLRQLQESQKYSGSGIENAFKRFFAGKNSAEYNRVQNTLSAVLDSMTLTLTDDAKTNLYIIQNAERKYVDLVRACNAYLKKDGGKSETGQSRRQIIAQIQKFATMDLDELQHLISESEEFRTRDLSGLKWTDILADARSEVIEIDDISTKTEFGNGVKKGDMAGRILDEGMFSPEETSVLLENGKNASLSLNAFSNEVIEGPTKRSYGFQEGEKVNISKRNVATSVVAELLGIGDLVEQSKTVKVYDKASGKTIRGNLMTKAKGIGGDDVTEKEKTQVRNEKDMFKREAKAENLFAPSIQKELSSLQVLDYICGQGDRNNKNYFMEFNEETGKYDHIHGIDNDQAFSTGVDMEELIRANPKSIGGMAGMKTRNVVSSNDDLEIPHMDKKLAQRILKVTDDEFRFALQGLIEPRFLELAVQRLKKVRNGIQKEMLKKDSDVFMEDGDWGAKTHRKFLDNSGGMKLFKDLRENGIGDWSMFNQSRYVSGDTNTAATAEQAYEYRRKDSYYSELILRMMGYIDFVNAGKFN